MPRGDHWPNWRDRLASGYTVDENGCHIWQKARTGKGYGAIYMDGKVRLAHRVAWYAMHGEWPDPELVVDHICNVKACVNTAHLRELTNGENIGRVRPGGELSPAYRRKSEAKEGVSIVV